MARKFYLMAIVFVALLMMGCSDDEKGMYFTKDEIVQGDINTGKQVGIKDNTIDVYTTEQGYVNVQGAVGKISATSVDENVAFILCK